MRRTMTAVAVIAVALAHPLPALGAPPAGSGSEGASAWADYTIGVDGGDAYLGVGASSWSYSDGDFGEEYSEADFYLSGEGFDCFGFAEVPFDLDNRLGGATVSAVLEGECFFYEPDGGGEEGDGEALHAEDGDGEESTPITANLEVEFVGVGITEHGNGFWRESGYRCSSHSGSRQATVLGTLQIFGTDAVPSVIDLSDPEHAALNRYEESCHTTGRPGPA